MVSFREIQLSDIEILLSMMKDFYAIDNYPIDINTSRELFETFVQNENLGKAWLIYNDDQIIGYFVLTFIFSFEYKGRISFLDELYIIENARGKKMGSKTLTFIKEQLPLLDVKLLYLEVEKHNDKAQKLYIAADFEFHNRKLMVYKPH